MAALIFDLHISAERMLEYYRGRATVVHAVATDGRSVQFPAQAIQRFVTEDGVHGRFRLEFDARNKFVGLERVG
ncbi:MAG: DUF2835 domain-containing protein [Limisphaerales bacterium]